MKLVKKVLRSLGYESINYLKMSSILNVLSGDASISLHLPTLIAVGSCFVLAATFVGSLYVWTLWPFTLLQKTLLESGQSAPSPYQRDHPVIIKRRSASLLCVCFLSPIYLALLAAKPENDTGIDAGLWRLIGVRWEGLLPAIALPFLLTHILFLGSHLLNHLEGMNYVYSEPHYWWLCFRNAIWVRNQIVAPATEEFVFRGCMVPLLVPILGSGESKISLKNCKSLLVQHYLLFTRWDNFYVFLQYILDLPGKPWFLDASTHLYKYKRVCPSVGPSVRPSVRNAFF